MTTSGVHVTSLLPGHWAAVARIYADGMRSGDATFETEVPSWPQWDAAHLAEHRFVAVAGADVVGWVAVSPVSDRCVYAGVVESSVYVADGARGQGIGRRLLERMISSTESSGVWTVQTGIFPENAASIRLHERVGFRVVGRRERLGKLAGRWRDVLFMERRSPLVD